MVSDFPDPQVPVVGDINATNEVANVTATAAICTTDLLADAPIDDVICATDKDWVANVPTAAAIRNTQTSIAKIPNFFNIIFYHIIMVPIAFFHSKRTFDYFSSNVSSHFSEINNAFSSSDIVQFHFYRGRVL